MGEAHDSDDDDDDMPELENDEDSKVKDSAPASGDKPKIEEVE